MDRTVPEQRGIDRYGAVTHEVLNQPSALADYNLFEGDTALREAVLREGAGWAVEDLSGFGARIGTAEHLELGALANRHLPEFDSHDRQGRRVDLVSYHPAYHALMRAAIEAGLHAAPWTHAAAGAHVARAAGLYLHSQVDAGHCCPISMTFAAVPCLRRQPDLADRWLPKITAPVYDARNVPVEDKRGLTIGMAMTEKQGGSDVRANTTRAVPLAGRGGGEVYELIGHKYFVSAPMCDAFLVLAYAEGGMSCFLVPRWRPDGSKNPIQLQQLKDKMGNASNASSETELRGAMGWLLGDEGRGIANILEMVALTRFDCMIGSSAGQRAATVQAIHHCSQRSAFGRLLSEQPLMRNVLADLALESEAALALTLRIGRALDRSATDGEGAVHEGLLVRLGTALGKYWICKRTPGHAYEAMECIGGSGVMETGPMPRLYREAPVNAIWEGSGNVQCLDMLRAVGRTPETLDALFAELESSRGAVPEYDAWIDATRSELEAALREPDAVEYRARRLVERMALALQACSLIGASSPVAEAFCRSRLADGGHHLFGTLPDGIDCAAVIERAWPEGSRA